jgi:ABC-2 type transport system permease protein
MGHLKQEFLNIFTNVYVILVIFGGLLLYAALYPQPYLNKIPLQQTVVVVDHDHTPASRRLIRYADATPQVHITDQVDSISQARELLLAGQARGMLVIPRYFERDLALSRSPVVGLVGDANFFLIYSTVIEGLAGVVMTTGAIARVGELLVAGVPLSFAVRDWSPILLNERPLFNVGMGYLGYVIPAVFVLILQQTLLLASCLVGAESKAKSGLPLASAGSLLGARFVAMFIVYFMFAQFYMGVCFEYYGISQNAGVLDLYLMIAAFLAASVALGMLLGLLLPGSEWAPPVVMVSSLPMAFTAGFIWPIELLPEPVLWISHWFPSTHAIQGFLKLNQMGAEFSQVLSHWLSLWALAVFFFLMSLVVLTRPDTVPKTSVSEMQ